MENTLIKNYQNSLIPFLSNGWANATEMGKAFGAEPYNWLRTEKAKQFITALQSRIIEQDKASRKFTSCPPPEVLRVEHGGAEGEHGTWMHPRLAMRYAIDLSPDFALWVIDIILALNAGETITPQRAAEMLGGVDHVRTSIDALWAKTVSNGTVTMRLKSIHGTPTQISDLIFNQTGEIVSPIWIGRAARIGVVSALVTRSATARRCVINRPA